ncbi:MAG: transferrin-binding protein-like solute binding protein, partial [Alphaproteobacteria bacterium]|nr:transferrin-binding protein-like solute binding protein [Alphaproteobacteria bacterium]
DAGVNTITGTVETAGDASNLKLTGNAEAYFFSTGVAELGGTFHMQNSLASYVGFFGGEREFYLFVNNITTAHADKPTSFNKHGLASFNDVNRNGKTDNAFKMIAVQVVRDKDNGTFTSNKFIDAVAEFDYNPDGTYSDMGMAFYLGDTKHDITDATVRINTNSYGDVTSTEVNGDGSDSYIFNSIFGNIVANIIFGFGEDGDNITSAGFGLTGFEMADDAIPNAGLIRFSGSGSGQIYGSDVNTLWSFALNADVDFSKRTVDITGQHPDYQGYAFSELDFAGTLQYKAGENMLIGGIESVGGDEFGKLTGDVEARFYGSGLNSLGGVFVMQNDIIGYAGYFVAGRVGYHSPPAMNIATTHAERPETFNQYGLTSFNDANRNSKTGNALKINSLVQASIDSDNRIITVDRITDAVVQFDYKGNGDFVDTGAILYMADKKYQITAGDGADGVFGSTMISGGDDSSDDITGFVLFKWTAGELFSFDSDYMALVQWPSFDDEHDNTHFGYGVTGFTTAGNTIPTTGNLTFIGTGTGYYLGATTYLSYASFSFKADVDFSKRVVNLSSTGFNSSDDRLEDAQLTAVLNYKIGENALTGKIETVGASDKYSALTGTVEANFYGPNTKNLGGTFNMSSSDSSYFGYFGGENKIATPPTSGNMLVTITDVAAPTTFTTLDSFNDDDRKGTSDNALQLNAAGVTRDGTTNALTTNKINGAVIEFDYQGNGHFADDGLTLYIAGKKHEITGATATENAIIFDAVSDYDEDDAFLAPPQILTLNRDRFGFTSNYMANIYWRSYVDLNLEESSFVALIQSSAIAGFETVGSAISTTSSNVSFSGKGRGHYHLSDDFGDIYFDVTADVNFSARTVSLFSTNACISSISYDCLELNNQLPRLNFTGNLSYASGTNAISGNVETAGDADNAKLTGTAEAKFYGPAAEELGGTFRMSNADIAYVGWFGATNNLVATPPTPPTSSPMLVTTDAEAPTTFTTLNSFNDNARKGTSDNALQANAVKITIDGTTKAITTNKISNSVVELDYQTNGDFSADGLTLYIAGKKHEINGATVSEHQIYYEISLTDDDIAAGIQPPHPQLISLDRSAFGFTSDYMARIFWLSYVDWSPSEDSYSSASIGYAITGFETSNIPNADTVATTFNGKGEGVYWQGNGDVVVEVLTFFDVTANVNFATRKVGLSSTNTCSSSNASLCAEGSDKLRPHFNWTGELSYAVDESDIAINAISGNVETAGDADNAKLTGTADARFYGPAAEELGGTFRMSNDDASYAGWFGAKK